MIRDVLCTLFITFIALLVFPRLSQSVSTGVLPRTGGQVSIIAGGTVLFDQAMAQMTQPNGGEDLFDGLKETLRPPCFFTFNFEVPVLSEIKTPEEDAYSPSSTLTGVETFLKYSGVQLVNLANDRNYGIAPAGKIIKMIHQIKIKQVGAGTSSRIANRPALSKLGPLRLAVMGVNTVVPDGALGTSASHPLKIARFNRYTLPRIKRAKKSADFLLVHIHWGDETTGQPTPEQIEQAHQLIDAGADIVIGHQGRVLQPIEEYKKGIIAYNLGDLAAIREDEAPAHSFLFCLTLRRRKPVTWKALPLTLNHGRPSLIPSCQEANQVMEQLKWK
jgi:gamma-polyglutamate biosynthesis protein CapA